VTATALPGGIQLKTTGDAAGWQVLCTWSTGEPRVMIEPVA
jgi:hypothetical protein